jgi:hypothetical protein
MAIDIVAIWFCFYFMRDEPPVCSELNTPSGAAMTPATIQTNDRSLIES